MDQSYFKLSGLIVLMLLLQSAHAQKDISVFDWDKVGEVPLMLEQKKLSVDKIPNPHWSDNACKACHTKSAKKASTANLRAGNDLELCLACHDARFDHSYIHPVDVKPDAEMRSHMKKPFKQSLTRTGNKVVCITCHDLSLQCLSKNRKKQGFNPKFFRGGPFKARSDLCFRCHHGEQYERLNAHDQIDDRGKLKENTCPICHSGSIEDLKKASYIDEVKFNLSGNLEKMCWGCHPWEPHPGGSTSFFSGGKGPDHLVKPSDKVQVILDKMSYKHEVDFPLEPGTGRVFCATCHNPHEKGVIKNKAKAKGADSEKRLRVQKICKYCHQK